MATNGDSLPKKDSAPSLVPDCGLAARGRPDQDGCASVAGEVVASTPFDNNSPDLSQQPAQPSNPTSGGLDVPDNNETKHDFEDGKRADQGLEQRKTTFDAEKQDEAFHEPLLEPAGPQIPENAGISIGTSHVKPQAGPRHPYHDPDYLLPMPAPEDIIDEGSDPMNNFPTVSTAYWESLAHNASYLNSRSLFSAYQLEMQRRETYRPGEIEIEQGYGTKDNKGPELIRAMAEYVGVMEEKITNLQADLAKVERVGNMSIANEYIHDNEFTANDSTENELNETTITDPQFQEADKSANVVTELETRFYHYDGAIDSEGEFVDPCPYEPDVLHLCDSKYLCRADPTFIRVLYDGNSAHKDAVQHEMNGTPNANEVDIIAFMVKSRPVSEFFYQRLGVETGPPWVLKVTKPFRSVFRNLQQLRDHLSRLVVKYGSEPSEPQNESTATIYDGVQQADDETGKSYSTPEALTHFRHLVQFIDKYLGVKAELFRKLRAGKEEKVAYEDLWMLFDTGAKIFSPVRCPAPSSGSNTSFKLSAVDEIHVPRRRYAPQAYRVIATIGGGPMKNTWTHKHVKMDVKYAQNNPLLQLFMGRTSRTPGVHAENKMKKRYTPLYVHCIYIDFDGFKYGAMLEIFKFKPFDGELDIRSLEAYPLQYHISPRPDYLLQRGQKFINITLSSKHMNHTGQLVGQSREELNSPVVVDLKLAFTEYQNEFPEEDSVVPIFGSLTKGFPFHKSTSQNNELFDVYILDFDNFDPHEGSMGCDHGPYCHGWSCTYDGYAKSQVNQINKLESRVKEVFEDFDFSSQDEDAISRFKKYLEDQDLIELLPGVVPGFALRYRKWVQLYIDQLDFIEQQDEWKKLALPKGHRKIVQAMVETYSGGLHRSTEYDIGKIEIDLVRGKGKGCIILLHGVPGVGKTSTAECVASYTGRPLYSITCGDVGYEPEDVERNMGKHFKLAHKWGCVLLLDEADVFLAKRNKTDVKRNGLVSAFLRILEYYPGILFLTTNRVGAIDDAFRSRLHLTLYYPKLTKDKTLKIWKTNLQRLQDINTERRQSNHQPIEFEPKKILKWVERNGEKMDWNGRQIRNAFQTAVALAEFEARQASAKDPAGPRVTPVLQIDHFKLLARATRQFSDYLHTVHGEDEDTRAAVDKVRAQSSLNSGKPKVKDRDFDDDEDDEESEEDESDLGLDSTSSEKSESDSDGASDSDSGGESSEDSGERSKVKRRKNVKGKGKAAKEEKKRKVKTRK